ncbi:MAG TPA: site-2 protease family protein [Verrucomicrobiae bacterium]|nr:site-2 protease family protein [Verrucomicrobiae bacterium]
MNIRKGSLHLFRFSGIDVFLHWSWFLVAAYEIQDRATSYSSLSWNALEYLALFLIVMLHEFGHALACRQVGGTSNQIVLWPLGGVAYVDPPQRPGATLWSLAAGPLVNVALLPILYGLELWGRSAGWAETMPNAYHFLYTVVWINLALLIFNMLPIYPLDGGQILRSLLWFGIGRARSLLAATIIGFIGVAGLIGLAVWARSLWFGVLAAFILLNCWSGLQHALALSRVSKLPRREGFACPSCKAAPLMGPYWVCSLCSNGFDTFQTQAVCPNCSAHYATTKCLDCGALHRIDEWSVPEPVPSPL